MEIFLIVFLLIILLCCLGESIYRHINKLKRLKRYCDYLAQQVRIKDKALQHYRFVQLQKENRDV